MVCACILFRMLACFRAVYKATSNIKVKRHRDGDFYGDVLPPGGEESVLVWLVDDQDSETSITQK